MFKLENCLLTNIPLNGEVNWTNRNNSEVYWYEITVNNETITISLCSKLYDELLWKESDISKKLDDNRILLIGELAKNGFQTLKRKIFHYNSCNPPPKDNHIKLNDFIDEILRKGDYPKNKKEKYNNLLKFLNQSQTFEGSEINIEKSIGFYAKLYFQSFEELQFLLREMQRKDLITYNEETNKVQFTFFGLEYLDTVSKSEQLNITFEKPQYDIGLSFAGEDRNYVEKVAEKLKQLGVTVFYDAYEQVNLWGKDLYQHLNDVYKNKCQYCIIFISEHYAKKLWTKHELKSAQARAFNENKEYILPARFDNTEVPGINTTVGYLDCSKTSPESIAILATEKLKQE